MIAEASERALAFTEKKEMLVVGGVAANSRLSAMLKGACKRHKAKLYTVSPKFSGDCGSQIACVGMLERKIYGGVKIKDAFVRQSWRLDGVDVNY